MYGFAKWYCFVSVIYILSCIDLEFCIIIDRYIGSPLHVKDDVDCINVRDKNMLNLEMAKLLNTESIHDNSNFYKFMQVCETE